MIDYRVWDCLSHRGTIKLVDQFGVGVDEKVVKWKAEIEENMDTTVSVAIIILTNYA